MLALYFKKANSRHIAKALVNEQQNYWKKNTKKNSKEQIMKNINRRNCGNINLCVECKSLTRVPHVCCDIGVRSIPYGLLTTNHIFFTQCINHNTELLIWALFLIWSQS